jgi:hypothetical protein
MGSSGVAGSELVRRTRWPPQVRAQASATCTAARFGLVALGGAAGVDWLALGTSGGEQHKAFFWCSLDAWIALLFRGAW